MKKLITIVAIFFAGFISGTASFLWSQHNTERAPFYYRTFLRYTPQIETYTLVWTVPDNEWLGFERDEYWNRRFQEIVTEMEQENIIERKIKR